MKKILNCTFVFLLAIISLFLINGCSSKDDGNLSYVTLKTNPSIELVVNEKGIVLAVNGTNDDGKLLLEGENLEGKTIAQATSKFVSLAEELGFIVKKSSGDEQTIEISVTADTTDISNNIKDIVKTEINKQIESLGLDLKLEEAKQKSREYFEEIVESFNPGLSDEEIKNLDLNELLKLTKEATKEKAQFVSTKLEEYYLDLKEYEFKFYYKNEIANAIESKYAPIKEEYKTILESFSKAIDDLKQLEVYTFTNSESEYVKAVNAYNEAKSKLMNLKVQLSVALENNSSTAALNAQIALNEEAFNVTDALLEKVEEALEATFDLAIEGLETIYDSLSNLEKSLPTDLKVEEKIQAAEDYINSSKNAVFKKFESSISKEKLAQMKDELKNRKEALKSSVSEAKK